MLIPSEALPTNLAVRVQAILGLDSPESLTLEYKRDPYAHTEGGRKEFSKDISAFANRDGGVLVIGVLEKSGLISVAGVPESAIDAEIQWLESVSRSGVSPHLFGLKIEAAKIGQAHIIIVEVPRGSERPYEALQTGGRFFVREEKSVRPMSREEIRSAVSNQLNLSAAIDKFIDDRWQALCGIGGMYGQLGIGQGGCLLIVTPIFQQTLTYRVSLPAAFDKFPHLRAFHTRTTGSARPNIDGLRYPMTELSSGKFHGYAQIYRHGAVELADGYVFDRDSDRPIPGLHVCEALIESTKGAVKTSHQLTGAPLYRVDFRTRQLVGTPIAFYEAFHVDRLSADRDDFVFDPIFVEMDDGWAEKLPTSLKPLLDAFWQAFGYVKCDYFNDANEWQPR